MRQPTRLGGMLRLYRTMREMSLRDLAPQIGIGHATLMRIEQGQAIDADTLLKLWTWLLGNPFGEPSRSGESPQNPENSRKTE